MSVCEKSAGMHWTLTDIGALLGTLSGLGSLVWNFVQWRKDQPSLLVKAKIMTPLANGSIGDDVLCITMINNGKRPMNITMIAGANTETEFLYKPINLPRILQEAESLIETYPISDKQISTHKSFINLYAADVQGGKWSVSNEDIAEFNKSMEIRMKKAGGNPGSNT